MKNNQKFKPNVIAVSILLAFPISSAWAEDEDVASLISPNVSEVSIKVENVDKDNLRFKKYSGKGNGTSGSIDLNHVQRSEDGRWITVNGKNIGLEDQEINATINQQGDWAVKFGYSQLPSYAPFTVNTAVQGVGSTQLTLPTLPFGSGASFSQYDVKTERTATSLAASKSLGFLLNGLNFNFNFKSEDKQGLKMATSGGNSFTSGGKTYSSQFFSPEPINANHMQFDTSLDYYSKKFQLTAGYYGSFYKNNMGPALAIGPTSIFGKKPDTPTGTTLGTLSTNMSAISLAPDNQAQEFYLSGGYNWSDDTRVTFKAGKTFGSQNDSFMSDSLIVPTTSTLCGTTQICPVKLVSNNSLDGKIEITNLSTSLVSKITSDLSVLASLSYEDRNDKTEKQVYLIDYAHGGMGLTNNPESMATTKGKLEANYKLKDGYKVTFGYDYDQKHYKGMEEEGLREKMTENTYRIDLRKSLSETVNGSIQLAHSERNGSEWGSTPNIYGDHWVSPTQFADRSRDKIKLLMEWNPVESLNLQFGYENAKDNYITRHNNMGLEKGSSELYSIDASYLINDSWKANTWYSLASNKTAQNSRQNPRLVDASSNNIQSCDGSSASKTCNPWSANLDLRSESFGAGIQGKVSSKIDLGAQYLYSRDVNKYNITVNPVSAGSNANSQVLAGAGALPDTVYNLNSFRVYANYALAKTTTVRLDYIYDVRKMNDYAWSSWRYSDGTTVLDNPKQSTQLIGITLIHSF